MALTPAKVPRSKYSFVIKTLFKMINFLNLTFFKLLLFRVCLSFNFTHVTESYFRWLNVKPSQLEHNNSHWKQLVKAAQLKFQVDRSQNVLKDFTKLFEVGQWNQEPILWNYFQPKFTPGCNLSILIGWKWSQDLNASNRMSKFRNRVNLRWKFLCNIGARLFDGDT